LPARRSRWPSYAIEGGHSNTFAKTKALMYGHPDAWHRLCEKLSSIVSNYLVAQIEAGVDAVQVFDSWVGVLSAADYREFALPHTRPLFDASRSGSRRFTSVRERRRSSKSCVKRRRRDRRGLAHPDRRGLDTHRRRSRCAGNLDPTLLLGPPARMLQQTDSVLARIGNRPGHIFNLGHGILPSTPVEHVQMLAQYVPFGLAPSLGYVDGDG
jgi:uroporphyrinogen decarboxylase